MDKRVAMPVAAGLIIGIIFVVLFASYFTPIPTPTFRSSPQRAAETTIITTGGLGVAILPASEPPVYDFLLKPGTSGYITVEYDYANATMIPFYLDTPALYMDEINNSTKLFAKLNPDDTTNLPYNTTGWRMYVSSPSDLKYFYEGGIIRIVQITYTIDVDASAEKATYGLPSILYDSHQLITIGNEHYEGPNPWA